MIMDCCLFDDLEPDDIVTFINFRDIRRIYRGHGLHPDNYYVPGTINRNMLELADTDLRIVGIQDMDRGYDISSAIYRERFQIPRGTRPARLRKIVKYKVVPADTEHPRYERMLELCNKYAFYNSMFKRKRVYESIEYTIPSFKENTAEDLKKLV